ncbi:MAG: DinB family protein [Acidimicrobiales bacterium]
MTCDECGFDYESVAAADAPAAIRAFGRRYRAPLTRFLPGEDGTALVRTRPSPDVWSALEYAAHVADVFDWYDARIRRSLVEDDPAYEGPDPDEAAEDGRYNEREPSAVVDSLAANADRLASTLESVEASQWGRTHTRRGEGRTVLFTAQRAVHEGGHHLLDIGRGMRSLRDQGSVTR